MDSCSSSMLPYILSLPFVYTTLRSFAPLALFLYITFVVIIVTVFFDHELLLSISLGPYIRTFFLASFCILYVADISS